jgi:hypothetical protein
MLMRLLYWYITVKALGTRLATVQRKKENAAGDIQAIANPNHSMISPT